MYSLYSSSSFAVTSPADTYIYELSTVANGIASVSSDNILRLHDPLALQKPLACVPKIHDEVTVLKTLDAENSVVCTAGRDGKVKIWDLRNGGLVGEVRCGKFELLICQSSLSSAFWTTWDCVARWFCSIPSHSTCMRCRAYLTMFYFVFSSSI